MDLSKNLCFLYRKQPMFVNPLQNFVTADQYCTSQDCVTKGFPHVSTSDNLLFNRKQAIPGKVLGVISGPNEFRSSQRVQLQGHLHPDQGLRVLLVAQEQPRVLPPQGGQSPSIRYQGRWRRSQRSKISLNFTLMQNLMKNYWKFFKFCFRPQIKQNVETIKNSIPSWIIRWRRPLFRDRIKSVTSKFVIRS